MLTCCRNARAAAHDGVTLIEVTVMLAVTAVLVSAMAPVASRTIDTARLARAGEDTDAIATAVHNFLTDFTTFVPFTTTGASGGTTVQMLVGDGDTPLDSSVADDNGAVAGAQLRWDDPVSTSGTIVDFLEAHIVRNAPIGGGSYAIGTPGWRGAYINGPVDPDPWGNRYAVNVEFLRGSTTNDVFVLSVGPDEEIDTLFEVNGITPGDDDITSVVRRDAGNGSVVP